MDTTEIAMVVDGFGKKFRLERLGNGLIISFTLMGISLDRRVA